MAIVVPKGSHGAYREQIVLDVRSVVRAPAGKTGTVKLTGVLRRLEQRRCRFEHPRHPRSMGLFRRLIPKVMGLDRRGPILAFRLRL
jgi:hypothetical protein